MNNTYINKIYRECHWQWSCLFFLWAFLSGCDTCLRYCTAIRSYWYWGFCRNKGWIEHGPMMTFWVSESPNPEAYLPWTTSYVRKYMIVLFKPACVSISVACSHQHPSSFVYTPNANVLPNKQFTSRIFLFCFSSAKLMLLSRRDDLFAVSVTFRQTSFLLSVALFLRQFQAS